MARSSNLNEARQRKDDEFYTRLEDIERELQHYPSTFRGKTVYCNCDDWRKSQFWAYFVDKFHDLGIKKVVATHYSPMRFDVIQGGEDARPAWASYDGVTITEKRLEGDGDFRSDECVELLKQADIIVTNPPFSLFRTFVSLLMCHDKQFLVLGSINAVGYREVLWPVVDGVMRTGCSGTVSRFHVNERRGRAMRKVDGEWEVHLGNVVWWTNINHGHVPEPLELHTRYSSAEYPRYDDYDAIEVGEVSRIPIDYAGAMGVPLSFICKWNPAQFWILGTSEYQDRSSASKPIQVVGGEKKYKRLLIKRRR